MVRSVTANEMPDPNIHGIPDLYDDLLLDLCHRRLETSDEYLDEVLASDWDEAPDVPSRYQELLSESPYTEEYDQTPDQQTGEMQEDLKQKSEKVQKVAKAIEAEFGVEGDEFTYKDIHSAANEYSNANSLRSGAGQVLKELGYLKDSSRTDENGSTLWIWAKSWDKTKAAQDPVADGGETIPWRDVITRLRKSDLAREKPYPDWFTSVNADSFVEMYEHLEDVQGHVDEIRATREDIEDGFVFNLDWERESLEEHAEALVSEFQAIFGTWKNIVVVAHDNIMNWAESNGKSLTNELDRMRPHKRQDRQRQRVEAKRFAIVKTYLKPLLTYPHLLTEPKYLAQTEEVIEAFMDWMWACYEDVIEHGGQLEFNLEIEDMIKEILDAGRRRDGGNHVKWSSIVRGVRMKHPVDLTVHEIYRGLKRFHEAGKDRATEWSGLRVWDDNDVSEDPEIVVEIAYNNEPSFSEPMVRDIMWDLEIE